MNSCVETDLLDVDATGFKSHQEYLETKKLLQNQDVYREVVESDVSPKVWKQIQKGRSLNMKSSTNDL